MRAFRDAIDWKALGLLAAALAAESAAVLLAFPAARLPHGYAHYVLFWLGRYSAFSEFGAAPGAVVFGVCLLAFVQAPPRWARTLTLPADGDGKARLGRRLLLAHVVSFAGFALVSASLLAHPLAEDAGFLAWSRLCLWLALAGSAALSASLALAASVNTGAPAVACFLPPALLLGFLADSLLPAAQRLIAPGLIGSTLWASRGALGILYPRVVYDQGQRLLGTPAFSEIVANGCSGSEGLVLMTAFCLLFWFVFRDRLRFPRALVLLPLGLAVEWSLNVLRVTVLIAIGDAGHGDFAEGAFHSSAGWLAFNAAALGLAVAAAKSSALGGGFLEDSPESGAAVPYLFPLLSTVFALFLTTVGATGVNFAAYSLSIFGYPLRVLITGAVLAYFWRRYRGVLTWTFSWPPVGIGALVFVLWAAAGVWHGRDAETPLIADALGRLTVAGRWSWIAVRVAGCVLTVPLAEELAFRGYLARWLVDSDFERVPVGRLTAFSFVASSAAFGLLHHRYVLGTLAGMAFAAAAGRRGRLTDAVIAHATTNALLSAFVVLTGNWGLWT